MEKERHVARRLRFGWAIPSRSSDTVSEMGRLESLLAAFAGIDVAIFMASQLLTAPEVFGRVQTTLESLASIVATARRDSVVYPFNTSAVPFLTAPNSGSGSTGSSIDYYDALASPIEQVGFVFLLLGMVRMHGCIHAKDKSAAEATLSSWMVELVFLGAQYTRLLGPARNGYLLATIVQVAIVGAMMLVVGMLSWSYRHYGQRFRGSTDSCQAVSPVSISPTAKLLLQCGWSTSAVPKSTSRVRR